MSTRPRAIELAEAHGRLPLTLKALRGGCYRDIFAALIKDVGGDVGEAVELVARTGNPQWACHILRDISDIPKGKRALLFDIVIKEEDVGRACWTLSNVPDIPKDKRSALFNTIIEKGSARWAYWTLRGASGIPEDKFLCLIDIVIEEEDAEWACYTLSNVFGIPEDRQPALERVARAA